MVSGTKALLDVALAAQALRLTGASLQVVKKKDKKVKDIVGLGLTNIVGISLLKTQAGFAAKL